MPAPATLVRGPFAHQPAPDRVPADVTVHPDGTATVRPRDVIWREDWQQAWNDVATAALTAGTFGPLVASNEPIASWIKFDLWTGPEHHNVLLVLRGGVPFEDLLTAAVAFWPQGQDPSRVANALLRAGRVLAVNSPAMSVHDALGWTMWAWSTGEQYASNVAAMVWAWEQAWKDAAITSASQDSSAERGRTSGFVYAAAGLSPHETSNGLARGTLSVDIARAMAALRGVPFPRT